MLSADAGSIPVIDGERLIGMITDRDIAVRGVAKGYGPDTPVRELMTGDIICARDDDDVDDAASKMSEAQVRRLPVIDDQERLCGIVSLGDLSREADDDAAERSAGRSQRAGRRAPAVMSVPRRRPVAQDGAAVRCLVQPLRAPGPGLRRGRAYARDFLDRLIDQLRVGAGVMALGDDLRGSLRRSIGGGGSEVLDGRALLGGDLVLGHPRTALDQRFGVGLRLCDDLAGLVLGALEQRFAILVDRRRLGLIFGLQRFGFLAQRLGFGELVADQRNLAVERPADRVVNLLPDEQPEDDQDRKRDPAARIEPEGGRLSARLRSAGRWRRSAAR